MRYLLDTNVLIDAFRGNEEVLRSMDEVGLDECAVSEIAIAELFYGAAKSGRKKHYDDVARVVKNFEILPIYPSLELYGGLKADLERAGNRVDEFDLLIAATALHNGLCLVTANTKHFDRIPKLRIENWKTNKDNNEQA